MSVEVILPQDASILNSMSVNKSYIICSMNKRSQSEHAKKSSICLKVFSKEIFQIKLVSSLL